MNVAIRFKNPVARTLETGIKDLPRNTSWLLSKALHPVSEVSVDPPSVHETAARVSEGAKSVGTKTKDLFSISDGSVEGRIDDAHAAAEKARAAEERALQAAENAKAKADQLAAISAEVDSSLSQLKKEQADRVEAETADARKRADAQVEDARRAAQQDANKVIEERTAEADKQIQHARQEADEAQANAKEELAAATDLLNRARVLSDEAEAAARAVVDEAHRQVMRITRTEETEAKEALTESARTAAAATATKPRKTSSRVPKQRSSSKPFDKRTKAELVELAAERGVKGRSSMSKQQLVKALSKTSH